MNSLGAAEALSTCLPTQQQTVHNNSEGMKNPPVDVFTIFPEALAVKNIAEQEGYISDFSHENFPIALGLKGDTQKPSEMTTSIPHALAGFLK